MFRLRSMLTIIFCFGWGFGYSYDDCWDRTGSDDEVFTSREGFDNDDDDHESFEAREMFVDDELSSVIEGSDDGDDTHERR